jgi:hypothetical protein
MKKWSLFYFIFLFRFFASFDISQDIKPNVQHKYALKYICIYSKSALVVLYRFKEAEKQRYNYIFRQKSSNFAKIGVKIEIVRVVHA